MVLHDLLLSVLLFFFHMLRRIEWFYTAEIAASNRLMTQPLFTSIGLSYFRTSIFFYEKNMWLAQLMHDGVQDVGVYARFLKIRKNFVQARACI